MAKYKLLCGNYAHYKIGSEYEESYKDLSAAYSVGECVKKYPSEWQLVEDRKIIGYKAPFDLRSINIKSGELCTLSSTGNEYVFKNHTYLPKEIVEQWEPVYESTYPDITINGYKGEFFDDYVKFGCAKIDKWLFVHFNKLSDVYPNSNRQTESVTIGKGTFTKDQIKEIAEYYLNKK